MKNKNFPIIFFRTDYLLIRLPPAPKKNKKQKTLSLLTDCSVTSVQYEKPFPLWHSIASALSCSWTAFSIRAVIWGIKLTHFKLICHCNWGGGVSPQLLHLIRLNMIHILSLQTSFTDAAVRFENLSRGQILLLSFCGCVMTWWGCDCSNKSCGVKRLHVIHTAMQLIFK